MSLLYFIKHAIQFPNTCQTFPPPSHAIQICFFSTSVFYFTGLASVFFCHCIWLLHLYNLLRLEMVEPLNLNEEWSGAFRVSIDDIDEEGLLGCENNDGFGFNEFETETEPLGEERCGESESNAGEGEPSPTDVGRAFADEEEAYEVYDAYALLKGFGVRKSKTIKSRTDREIIRRRYVCNKECHKLSDKRQEG